MSKKSIENKLQTKYFPRCFIKTRHGYFLTVLFSISGERSWSRTSDLKHPFQTCLFAGYNVVPPTGGPAMSITDRTDGTLTHVVHVVLQVE